MDNYIVSARKYRPVTFDTVVGQEALTTTLKNAIATNKLAHAYLFCGPRGVGKTTCARIFAKTINCLSPLPNGDACDNCESCRAFNEQRSFNIHELDAASNNSVDDIRNLIEQVRIPPQVGAYKVYIIDEVHMLSQNAFNAFLKTLEEPPHHTIFILATTEKHKILPTILSRCQIYDFNRITLQDTVDHLAKVAANEGIEAEPEALQVIAQKADGGMRDALSIFDQVASFTSGHITYSRTIDNLNVLDYEYYFRLTQDLLAQRVEPALLLLDEVLKKGFDGQHFINGLQAHFRDLLVARDVSTLPLLEVGAATRQRYLGQAQQCRPAFLYQAMKLCNDCDLNYRQSKNKRFYVELTLIQIAQLNADEGEDLGGRSPVKSLKPLFSDRAAGMAANVQTTQPATPANTVAAVQLKPVTSAESVSVPKEAPPLPALQKQPAYKRVKAGQLGFSIRKGNQSALVAVTQETVKPTVETVWVDEAVRPEELDLAWREFAMRLPHEERATQARLMNVTPQLSADGKTIEGGVENEMVKQDIGQLIPRMLEYFAQRLHNRSLRIVISVNEHLVKVKVHSPLERYQLMAEKNPNLERMKELFNLQLS